MARRTLAWITILGFAALAACGPSEPSLDSERLEAAKAAAAAMDERFNAADPAGDAPRASDPVVADDLSALYDSDYIAGLETLPIAEAERLTEWSVPATAVGVGYLLWGTGKETPAELAGDPAALARVNDNTVAYRDELGLYFDFSLYLTEAIGRATAARLAEAKPEAEGTDGEAADGGGDGETSNLVRGAGRVRAGFIRTILGTIGVLQTPGLPDEWLVARLPAINATRDTAKSLVPPERWEQLATRVRAIAQSIDNGEVATALNAYAE